MLAAQPDDGFLVDVAPLDDVALKPLNMDCKGSRLRYEALINLRQWTAEFGSVGFDQASHPARGGSPAIRDAGQLNPSDVASAARSSL